MLPFQEELSLGGNPPWLCLEHPPPPAMASALCVRYFILGAHLCGPVSEPDDSWPPLKSARHGPGPDSVSPVVGRRGAQR